MLRLITFTFFSILMNSFCFAKEANNLNKPHTLLIISNSENLTLFDILEDGLKEFKKIFKTQRDIKKLIESRMQTINVIITNQKNDDQYPCFYDACFYHQKKIIIFPRDKIYVKQSNYINPYDFDRIKQSFIHELIHYLVDITIEDKFTINLMWFIESLVINLEANKKYVFEINQMNLKNANKKRIITNSKVASLNEKIHHNGVNQIDRNFAVAFMAYFNKRCSMNAIKWLKELNKHSKDNFSIIERINNILKRQECPTLDILKNDFILLLNQ